jgi:hypothetical protein
MENTERLYKILDSQISKKSVNKDFDVNIGIDQKNRPLPLNNVNSVINQSEVFDSERVDSEKYSFLGSIRQVMSNVLINITGERSYQSVTQISNSLNLNSPKEIINETDGWFSYRNSTCNSTEFKPNKSDLLMINNGLKDNWTLDITYPYSGTSNTLYFNTNDDQLFPVYLVDGIAIHSVQNVVMGGQNMTLFELPIKHGLFDGDEILITGNTIYDGIHTIFKVGDDENGRLDNTFIINIYFPIPTIQNTFGSIKRIVNNIPSQYILRHFKKITKPNDVDFYYASFSKTYFNDDVISFNTNSEINLLNYRDYLNRPITEVYLSVVKNKTGVGYGFWGDLKSGLQTNVPKVNYDIRQINECTGTTIDLGLVNSFDDTFLGDIVDYNEGDLTERVLVEVNHRFNSINRYENGYCEGYFYSPHKKMVISYYSTQIEFSDNENPTVNIPDYAIDSEGRKMWRDILTKGYVDEFGRGVDYPFLNGINYVTNNTFLSLKRQDPELNYNHGNNPIFIGVPCSINGIPVNIQNVC